MSLDPSNTVSCMPLAKARCKFPNATPPALIDKEIDRDMIFDNASLIQIASQTLEYIVVYDNQDDCYELVELTESDDEAPLRRRAESVAVLSWRLVCSCMILIKVS